MSNQLDVILSKLLKVPSVFRIGKQHNIHSFFIVLHFSENIPVGILQLSWETIKVGLLHFTVDHYGVNECIKYKKWAKYNIMTLIVTKYAIKL